MIQKAISHYKYGISHDIFSEPVTSYAKLSIEALEKQIQQKVVNRGYLYGYAHHCPICNHLIYEGAYGEKAKFCSNCGQALDWSE